MSRSIQVIVVGLALSVSACARDRAPEESKSTEVKRDAAAVGTSGDRDRDADAEFVQEQLAVGTAEIDLGKLAQQRGQHPQVLRYARLMVNDHTAAGDGLKRIANAADANRATGEDVTRTQAAHLEVREELSRLSGHEFDKRYMDRMIEDHAKAISDVETKSQGADDARVRQWAAKALPKMREHLEQARAIRDVLKNEGDKKKSN